METQTQIQASHSHIAYKWVICFRCQERRVEGFQLRSEFFETALWLLGHDSILFFFSALASYIVAV